MAPENRGRFDLVSIRDAGFVHAFGVDTTRQTLFAKQKRGIQMYDIIVIGGGPAGLTAALYAARAGKSVLVLEGEATGDQIVYSPLVENYPGLPGMSGADFADQLTAQVEELGVEIVPEEAVTAVRQGSGFRVTTDEGVYDSLSLVLATGVRHRHLGLPGEEDLVGAGVCYCAVCDGPFYQGRAVAVVGGGDTALQDAFFLAGQCASVTIIHRRDQFRGEQMLVDKLRGRENVHFLLSHTVQALQQTDGALTGLMVQDVRTGESRLLAVDGLFVAVGQEPRSQAFLTLAPVDERGYFLAGEDTACAAPGVFIAGDCRDKQVRQLTTAVGDGAVAGLAACRYVENLHG